MTLGVVGLDPAPFTAAGHVVDARPPRPNLTEFIGEFAGYSGFALAATADPQLRAACDFVDGIAGRTGVIDTVVFQPAGSSELIVGFAALPGALGRAITDVLGTHAGRAADGNRTADTTAVILGADQNAACAVAAAVQHGYGRIVLATDVPGPAITAAHRMDIDVETVRTGQLAGARIDLLVNTLERQVEAAAQAVCDLTGAWRDFAGPYVSPELITAHQRQDQIRVLTGVNPQFDLVLDSL